MDKETEFIAAYEAWFDAGNGGFEPIAECDAFKAGFYACWSVLSASAVAKSAAQKVVIGNCGEESRALPIVAAPADEVCDCGMIGENPKAHLADCPKGTGRKPTAKEGS